MLTESCRVFTLAVPDNAIADVDLVSERWSVWSMEISATALKRMPRRGDVVVWRAFWPDEPMNWYLPGGPSRVVAIESAGDPDVRQVLCLRDAQLDKYAPGPDDWPYRLQASDRMLPRSREWDLLGTWRLHPPCPRCGGTSREIIFGEPVSGSGGLSRRAERLRVLPSSDNLISCAL